VIRKLGAGGMGEVYLACDPRLDRTVAIKVLPDDLARDQERLRRFLQEAKAASALNHPNVCIIYEVDRAENGQPFIAMEYIEGQSLDERINGEPLAQSEIIDIAIQVADALDEAHARGIVHRDIKPANLMITPRGQVKVLDFGLAKINAPTQMSASDIATMKQTSPGMVMGTVQYMSPEQAIGKPTDHRTDIFSLGVAIYEMTTGRLPFNGSSTSEIIDRINHSQPDAIARFNYDAPSELERIIRKCLEKDRERRYQSARELLIDLKNLKRDSESGAVALTASPAKRPVNDRRALIIAPALAAILLAVIGLFFLLTGGKSESAIISLAVLPLANASADPAVEYLSDGVTESIINNLSQLSGLRVIARPTAFRYKGRDHDPQSVGRELKVDAVMTGRLIEQSDRLIVQVDLVRVSDGAQMWGERYNRPVKDILSVQEEIAREISSRLQLKLTGDEQKRLARRGTENSEAYQLWLKGRYQFLKWTAEGRRKSIEYFNEAIEKDPTFAPAFAWLSGAYDQQGVRGEIPRDEAKAKARAYAMKALELDEQMAEAHAALGITKWREWDWTGAEEDFRRAIDLNPKWPDGHDIYASFLISTARVEEALLAARRAGELDPLSLGINNSTGLALYLLRRWDQAAEQFEKTLDLFPDDADARNNLALTLAAMGKPDEAIAEARKTRNESPTLGYLLALSGKRAESEKVIEKSSGSRIQIAAIYAALGERDRAFGLLEKAVSEKSEQLGVIKVDPRFDPLHSDPRFQALIDRLNLPH
jgi:serine/threonine protein kinase/Flp pilus assembly protein TadD